MKPRLLVYGCSFSSPHHSGIKEADDVKVEKTKSNYASLLGIKLGYENIDLRGVGGYTNKQLTNLILQDIENNCITADDDIIIQQTSPWRTNVGDSRFLGTTLASADVIDYNHPKYSNDEFYNEILFQRKMVGWYVENNDYHIWLEDNKQKNIIFERFKNKDTYKAVQHSISEWDAMLTSFCFLSTALAALRITSIKRKIYFLPFIPLTYASYDKFIENTSNKEIIKLLYGPWSYGLDTHSAEVLKPNPMNYYYNNSQYWDENNKDNFRKADHSTDEFHSNLANILYEEIKNG